MKSIYNFAVYSMDKERHPVGEWRWHIYEDGKFGLGSHLEGYLDYEKHTPIQQLLFRIIESRYYPHRMIAIIRKKGL